MKIANRFSNCNECAVALGVLTRGLRRLRVRDVDKQNTDGNRDALFFGRWMEQQCLGAEMF